MSNSKPRVEGSTAIPEFGITAPPAHIQESLNSAPPARDETRRTWARDYSNVCEALQPHVRTLPDGFAYVDEDTAPPAMVALYRMLVEVGAARGWMP